MAVETFLGSNKEFPITFRRRELGTLGTGPEMHGMAGYYSSRITPIKVFRANRSSAGSFDNNDITLNNDPLMVAGCMRGRGNDKNDKPDIAISRK